MRACKWLRSGVQVSPAKRRDEHAAHVVTMLRMLDAGAVEFRNEAKTAALAVTHAGWAAHWAHKANPRLRDRA